MADGGAAIARLFVAVDLPALLKDEVARVAETMHAGVPNVKWVPRDNLHITLAFLGSTPLVNEVTATVRATAAEVPAFGLHLEGTGAFPSARRARVLWVGLGGGVDALAGVARSVAEALAPLGFSPDHRPFSAHVTIGRLRDPVRVEAGPAEVSPLSFTVEALTVFQSHLGRPAPRYEAVATCPLSGD